MRKKEELGDLKAVFEEELELPESLSKENIVEKIKAGGAKQEKKKKVKAFPKILAAAAAFAIVATGAFAVFEGSLFSKRPVRTSPAREEHQIEDAEPETAEQNGEEKVSYPAIDVGTKKLSLSKFDSDKDLENYFKNISAKYKSKFETAYYSSKDGAAFKVAAPEASSVGTNNADNYGKTNTQVSGVDEGDIVKNDGRYLYTTDAIYGTVISVLDTESMTVASQFEVKPSSKKNVLYITELYLNGDRLIVTGYEVKNDTHKFSRYDSLFWGAETSVSIIYDISDKTNVTELRRTTQDGEIIASRMVGSYLYTVTICSPNPGENDDCVPKVDNEKLGCDSVYITDSTKETTRSIILTGYDTAVNDSAVSKVSVLSNSGDIYCSQQKLYVASHEYNEDSYLDETAIHVFTLSDGSVAYKGSVSVPGYCSGQYMMDEYSSYFRIATTDYNVKKDVDISSLYVIDENLNVVGKLENISEDEQIKSARFLGNTAYIVTFKNTDPLFAIDLSDPSKPKILGEVKLPGFSSYLHPLSENLLVGIGFDGDEESADMTKIKISLFDVSDKKNPKELDSHVIKNASCDISQSSAKAYVQIDENTFGIPVYYQITTKDLTDQKLVFKTFTVENNKFSEKNAYIHSSASEYSGQFRGTFIGDKIYTLDGGILKQFDAESEKVLSALSYKASSADDETPSKEGDFTVAVSAKK